ARGGGARHAGGLALGGDQPAAVRAVRGGRSGARRPGRLSSLLLAPLPRGPALYAANHRRAGSRRARSRSRAEGSVTVFALGVLAHDEEGSIARMLASVVGQSLWRRLPPAERQIVVYANGCSDATAARARGAGVTCGVL